MSDITDLDTRRAAMTQLGDLMAKAMEPEPVPEQYIVTVPGVYPDLPAEWYFADPVPQGSLSRSAAGGLLPPGTPAQFRYNRDNRTRVDKPEFDFGHAAHWLVLEGESGLRARLVDVHDYPDWRLKAAQEARKASRAAGRAPVLTEEWERVKGMAAAIRQHPLASRLFDPDHGQPEVSLFWEDGPTGVVLSCRVDWMPDQPIGGEFIVPDYKTAACAYPPVWRKSAADFGYHRQNAWYLDGTRTCGIHDDPLFLFVVQEPKPPYLVSVIGLYDEAVAIGIDENRYAVDLYASCKRLGVWPGYSEEVEYVDLPPYYRSRAQETQ